MSSPNQPNSPCPEFDAQDAQNFKGRPGPSPSSAAPCENSKPGRRRDEDVRCTILKATRNLAQSCASYKAFTVEGIAKEAKVSKATIYRWWSSKLLLLTEACRLETYEAPNTGSLVGDLEDLIRQEIEVQCNLASRPVYAGAWAEMVELVHRESQGEVTEFVCHTGEKKRAAITQVFEQAQQRGEWQGPAVVDHAYGAMYSSVFFWCVGRGDCLGDARITRLANRMIVEAKPLEAA